MKLLNGREVDAMPVWQMYLVHFQDYDLDTVHQICRSAEGLSWSGGRGIRGTIKPAAIHNGEGTNHYFHMTINSRGAAMVLIVTGNVGKFGTGHIPGPGNYKAGVMDGHALVGRGLGGAYGRGSLQYHARSECAWQGNQDKILLLREEVGYWNHGDTALIVNTPKYGRKVFTGKTHMPSPSKFGG